MVLAALTHSLQSTQGFEEEPEVDEFPVDPESDDAEALQASKLEAEKLENFKNLFKDCKFFLSREVPREVIVFMIRSFGGEASWDSTIAIGATYSETDETITHQIIDRPVQGHKYLSRYYVQPQWIADSINQTKLLPVEDYFIGTVLPPHLSPFVQEQEGDYVPPERQAILDEENQDKTEENESPEMNISKEEKELAVAAMPRKDRRLYEKIMHSKKKKRTEVRKLEKKRRAYDEEKKTKKIKSS
ncbi:Pescadillo-like [Exaiptasia diaphana]|nr:Pescadillo-like [Exaiptasia diaphana]